MSGTFSILSRGLDGVHVNLRRMGATANNIANINTQGYSRQRVEVQARQTYGNETGGGGVEVIGVRNTVNKFLELQLFTLANNKGTLEGRQGSVSILEETFNEAQGMGLSKSLADFFNGFKDLGTDPTNLAMRTTIRERARNVINDLHSKSSQLSGMLKTVSQEMGTRLETANAYLTEIASLNRSIAQQELGGQGTAFELRDRRTLVLSQLSGEMNVNFYESDNGMVNVYLANGVQAVTGGNAGTFALVDTLSPASTATVNLTIPGGGATIDVTSGITGGCVGGNLIERNTHIYSMATKLDTLAYTLVTEVNNLHFNGYGLNGATHNNFFATLGSSTDAARLIDLDASITADVRNIAAAQQDPTSVSGPSDNRNAIALSGLVNSKVMNGNSETMTEYYRNMIGELGVTANSIRNELDAKTRLFDATQQQREAVSGVNMDEEGADLIRFQRAFEASVRLMQVGSELLDTIIKL